MDARTTGGVSNPAAGPSGAGLPAVLAEDWAIVEGVAVKLDDNQAMIVGIGTDLAEIDRVRRSIERFGDRFLARVYTPEEIAYCLSKKASDESFAARFAAKEAGAKALGTGISQGVSWREFAVQRALSGQPSLHLNGRAAQIARELGVVRISISLTHTRDLAMAVVILESA